MAIELDPKRQHDWRRMTITPLVMDEKGVLEVDENRSTDVKVGCWNCNMGFDEGKDVNCPGQDLFVEGEDINDVWDEQTGG